MEILDEPQLNVDRNSVLYAGFWPRLGALFLDGLILTPLTFGVMYFNITSWKSVPVLVIVTVLSLSYKPFMEYNYGATLGKMALRLKVVNLQFEKADLQEILLRNIFHIVPPLITLFITIGIYSSEEFQDITGFREFSTYSNQHTSLQIINVVSGIITLVDMIVMLSDSRKRSLHDKIGGTYVIERRYGDRINAV
jgi:uncharacterized RDD family membrane protein YckC